MAPSRLALVIILQFVEGLADRQARLGWKYLLGLELTDKGFDIQSCSSFALDGEAEKLFLDVLLEQLRERKLLEVEDIT